MPEQQPLDELEELRGFARTLGTEGVEWETPPPELWDRISAEAFPAAVEPTTPVVALAARRSAAEGSLADRGGRRTRRGDRGSSGVDSPIR